MIGDIVHITRTNNQASQRPVCHPALIMGELPNDKLDLGVIIMSQPVLGQMAVPKGEIRKVGSWHNANHKEN